MYDCVLMRGRVGILMGMYVCVLCVVCGWLCVCVCMCEGVDWRLYDGVDVWICVSVCGSVVCVRGCVSGWACVCVCVCGCGVCG